MDHLDSAQSHPEEAQTRRSRRAFIATASSGLVGASLVSTGAPAQIKASAQTDEPSPSALERIDCQSHLFCPALVERMEARLEDPIVYRRGDERFVRMDNWHRKILPNHMDVAAKLASMDRAGIQITALSINDPGPEWFGKDGVEVARIANDYVAGIVTAHPTRFIGLAVLPLPDVQASLAELDRAVSQLKLRGLLMYTNIAGRFPDEPEFRPVWAKAAALNVPVLLHPAKPLTTDVVQGYEMTSSLGNMFDNTIALTRIIMSGMLDELPKLQLVCPHLGGTLPYIVGRIDHQTQVLKRGPKNLTRAPSEYLKQVYLDVVSPWPLGMRLAYDYLGPDRLLFASDHPWVEPELIASALTSLDLPATDSAKIFGGNARRLFRID